MPQAPTPMQIEREQANDRTWLSAQMNLLSEAILYDGFLSKVTPEQMARLLREVGRGCDWRNGAWK